MELFRRKKELKKVDKSERAGKEAFDALNNLKEDMPKKPIKEVSEEFFDIVKKFFSNYFNMKYEFTHDEFSRDLKRKRSVGDKIKDIVASFSNELADMKYKYEELTLEQLKKAIEDFSGIVTFLVDKKKHESVYEQTRRLTDYVRFALQKGKSKAEIEKALIAAGWPSSVVKRELEKI